jgi:hypothetical protein
MEIEKFCVKELTNQEELQINGGGWLGDTLNAIWEGICNCAEFVWYKFNEWRYETWKETVENY